MPNFLRPHFLLLKFKPFLELDVIKNLIKIILIELVVIRKKLIKKNIEKIKIGFVLHELSMWKFDLLFKQAIQDENFDPIILIIPQTNNPNSVNQIENYCKVSKYNYIKLDDLINLDNVKVRNLSINVLFVSYPYIMNYGFMYQLYLSSYPTFYSPYYCMCTKNLAPDDMVYGNQLMRNAELIFFPHDYANEKYKISNPSKNNSICVGYPFFEELIQKRKFANYNDAWCGDERVKIIYAPHHSIKEGLSTFLHIAEFMVSLVEIYKDNVKWCFKPHPGLRKKLELHKDWGFHKTKKYWDFWAEHEASQFFNQNYIDLFLSSDAMIHDCNSFVGEYWIIRKPVMFLAFDTEIENVFNDFGLVALGKHVIANSETDVHKFIQKMIQRPIEANKISSIETYSEDSYMETPSAEIICKVKESVRSF